MTFQELDIIKSRTLVLKNNIPSGEVILTDPSEGDMYFTFVGTYGPDHKELFLGFVVQPQLANSGQHNVIITFYTGKEAHHGN